MKMERDPVGQWLDAATKAIRFGPDRRAVRSELSAHLEDKALDFQRIFPGLTQEEAQDRAAAEMGDPAEIGRELARLHKPLLGYAWLASKVLLGVVIGAGVLLFANRTYQSGLSNLLDGGLVRQGTRQVRDYETGTAELRAQGSLEDTGLLRLEIAAGDDREAVLLQELFFESGYELADGGERWRGCTITRADCRLELFDGDGGSMGERPVAWATEP